ncbi:MAG: HEAT repeat domain-containing protein [Planctomycetota bacterium]
MSRLDPRWLVGLALFGLLACGRDEPAPRAEREVVVPDPTLLDRPEGEDPNREAVIGRLQALRPPLRPAAVEALLTVMKDKSQQAFITVPDASPLGYHVEESPYGGPDLRAQVRWTAMMTIERLGLRQALPDLLSGLHDRHPVVRAHAARALWHLGSDAGVEVLLKGLEGKAIENEPCALALREISGRAFGFDTDSGWANKSRAIAAWRVWWESGEVARPRLPAAGEDAALDRRVRFLVDVLGQHQFLFMEQARRALGQLGDLAVTHIEDALAADANDQLRAYAAQVLEAVGTPRARAILVRLLAEDRDGAVRMRSATALGTIGGPEAEKALLSVLSDGDAELVGGAAEALGRLGAAAARPALEERLAARPGLDRIALKIAVALVRLVPGHEDAVRRLESVMAEGPAHLRTELAQDLEAWKGDLGGWDPRADPATQAAAREAWRERFGGR